MKPMMINLWAPPGVGKSRTAAALFHTMKTKGYRVEAPYEVAKTFSYQANRTALLDPLYITGLQEHLHWMLIGQVDYIISDSPTGIGLVYTNPEHELWAPLRDTVRAARTRYRCVDIRLTRVDRSFELYGREHSEEQSKALEWKVDDVLQALGRWPCDVPHFPASELAAAHILGHIELELRSGR